MNKIVLGTAQFGMDYGINNKRGKIPQSEANEILNVAAKSGIDTVDTAYAYGSSEEILGNFMKSSGKRFKIISKLPECKSTEVEKKLSSSLDKLNLPGIYGYMVHNYENYKNDRKIWDELRRVKRGGWVEKIGFSLYRVSELESILSDRLEIDILQIPYSIFDQRFAPYLPGLKKGGVEIYARSIFLQGVVFKKPSELEGRFEKAIGNIERLNLLSKETQIPIFALCLGFAIKEVLIDKVVAGVDSIRHFQDIMRAGDYLYKLDNINSRLAALSISDENIILPPNWGIHEVKLS